MSVVNSGRHLSRPFGTSRGHKILMFLECTLFDGSSFDELLNEPVYVFVSIRN
jgi:hypothetical protein